MNDHLIPSDIRKEISKLGFFPITYVPLFELHSIVGLKDEQHYNIQLNEDLSVYSIHLLKYRWNATGAKILDINRVKIG